MHSSKEGCLNTLPVSVIMTTQAWLDDYIAGRWERKPKPSDDSVDE